MATISKWSGGKEKGTFKTNTMALLQFVIMCTKSCLIAIKEPTTPAVRDEESAPEDVFTTQEWWDSTINSAAS